MPSATPPILVSLDKLPPLPELAACWRELETRAQASFFLTWSWIGVWLQSLGDHAHRARLLCARQEGQLVGLAIVFDAPIRRRLLPMGRAAYINETGVAAFDALTIEHNGLLLDTANASAAQKAMLGHMCEAGSSWREVNLRYADCDVSETTGGRADGLQRSGLVHECRTVKLGSVRERGGDFVGLLGAGRRAHVRRCMRAYAAIGPLQLTQARDVPTALEFLGRLLVLHSRRWTERGEISEFVSPFCRAFHQRIVTDALPRGEVQILRISAGEKELGYLYSFVHKGRVCFYQSGYDYKLLDRKYSPGLVTLVLAIEHNAALGMEVFDFLAGNQAYKTSLATDSEVMTSWTVRRRSLVSAAERALRWKLQLVRRGWARLRSAGVRKGVNGLGAVLFMGALAVGGGEFVEFDEDADLPSCLRSCQGRPRIA